MNPRLFLLAVPAAIAVTVLLVVTGGVAMLGAGAQLDTAAAEPGPGAVCTVTTDGTGLTVSGVQVERAQTIVQVANEAGTGEQGATVGIATAMQESQLKNLASRANPDSLNYPHDDVAAGDHDSVGLFQQRDAWGPMGVRMDPEQSAGMFYRGGRGGQPGLLDIPGWQSMSIAEAAQAVQVSAFPDAYAQWEPLARALVDGSTVRCDDGSATVPAGEWTAPIAKGQYTLSSGFGPRGGRVHEGIDLSASAGTPIRAAAAGQVTFSGMFGTCGNTIFVEHGGGVATKYCHQSQLIARTGDTVDGGQVIGKVGNTGRSTGPHLHLEVQINATAIDPIPFLRQKGVTL